MDAYNACLAEEGNTAATAAFIQEVHESITTEALGGLFPPELLSIIIDANLAQDEGAAFEDPLNHGDNNLVQETIDLINSRIDEAVRLVELEGTAEQKEEDLAQAAELLGQAMHAIQDLVSHSDYVPNHIDDYVSPDQVPIPDFLTNGTQDVTTGTYDPNNPNATGTPGNPTHFDMNLDTEDCAVSPRGCQEAGSEMPSGTTLHDVAADVATRETERLYEIFLDRLSPNGQDIWGQAGTP
jgi:hypothetical protein